MFFSLILSKLTCYTLMVYFIYTPTIKEVGNMENKDIQLINKLIPEHAELRKLWEEHLEYKATLEEFNKKKYLSAEDELKRKEIQKLKLSGKDRIEDIIQHYRQ